MPTLMKAKTSTGKRPVIAMRIHQKLYDDLRKSAESRKLSISEDAENRISQSFEWQQAERTEQLLVISNLLAALLKELRLARDENWAIAVARSGNEAETRREFQRSEP